MLIKSKDMLLFDGKAVTEALACVDTENGKGQHLSLVCLMKGY